jgi:hypothetical protein
MANAISLPQLRAIKDRFGSLVFLDLTAYDLRSAHRLLGVHVRSQVHKILCRRLDCMGEAELSELLRQGRVSSDWLARRAADPALHPRLRTALQEYLDCLLAWADGAELAGFDHPALAKHRPLTIQDLALLSQNDFGGCQTGLYRLADGSIILWHTEENIEDQAGDIFDQLRIATFQVDDGDGPISIQAFIYPDLLPGPAFGWRSDGYSQAMDVLHIRLLTEQDAGTLANTASWLTLRLGATMEVGEVLTALRPFFDGYALNAAYIRQGQVHAEKYEYAGDCVLPYRLDEQPGSYLFQVNIFCQKDHPQAQPLEELTPLNRGLYEQRHLRTTRAMQRKKSDGTAPEDEMRFFLKMIASRHGDDWAYANPDVKAHFVQHLTPHGSEIWLGHGPATADEQLTQIKI